MTTHRSHICTLIVYLRNKTFVPVYYRDNTRVQMFYFARALMSLNDEDSDKYTLTIPFPHIIYSVQTCSKQNTVYSEISLHSKLTVNTKRPRAFVNRL